MTAPTDTDDDTTMLVQFLHDRDVECPVCKYNLRMLTTPRCPECGTQIKLTIGAEVNRAWIITIIPLWMAMLPGVIFFSIALIEISQGHMVFRNFTKDPQLYLTAGFSLLSVLAAPALTLNRRWFLKRSRKLQQLIAGTVVTLAVLALVIFLMMAG